MTAHTSLQHEARQLIEEFINDDPQRIGPFYKNIDGYVSEFSDEFLTKLLTILNRRDETAQRVYRSVVEGISESYIQTVLHFQQRIGSSNYALTDAHVWSLGGYGLKGIEAPELDDLENEDKMQTYVNLILVTRAVRDALVRSGVDPERGNNKAITNGLRSSTGYIIHSLEYQLVELVLQYGNYAETLIRIINASDNTTASELKEALIMTLAHPQDEQRIITYFKKGIIRKAEIEELLSGGTSLSIVEGVL